MMKLTVIQQPEKGSLGGPKEKCFSIVFNEAAYSINITQCVVRKIIISSEATNYKDYLTVYYRLVSLLMLFDGQFYPIIEAYENDIDITTSMKKRELASHTSADIMRSSRNKLIDYDLVIDENVYNNWSDIQMELDINYKMVLYCLSSVKMPTDVKCAFMIESFKALCELVSTKQSDFRLPEVSKNESKLGQYIKKLIKTYGNDVFIAEIDHVDNFVRILVNSRNRIAHIRTFQGKVILCNGQELFYLLKLSILYRKVLFSLLNIPVTLYCERLSSAIDYINEHDVVKQFINYLGSNGQEDD